MDLAHGTMAPVVAGLVGIATLAWQNVSPAAPRLPPLPASEWNDTQRSIAAEFGADLGTTNAIATYLHNETLAEHVLPFERYIVRESQLEPRYRELLSLRTAWGARSSYVWAHRAGPARIAGLTTEELKRVAIGPTAPGWDPFEAALLRAADQLRIDSFIDDATWRILASRLSTEQLMDAAFTVGEFTMISGLVNSLGVEIEPQLTDRLPSGVPYTTAAKWTNERLIGRPPRIPPLEPDAWSADVRQLLDPTGAGRRVPNVYRTYVRNLPLDLLRRRVSEHIRDATTLSDRHREFLIIRIGVLCRSEYEWAAHERVGRRVGLNDSDIQHILDGPGPYGDPVETALLRATDELYRDDAISDETWKALAAAFDTRQILDLIVAIGGYRMFSAAMNSFGVQLDPDSVRFPPELR